MEWRGNQERNVALQTWLWNEDEQKDGFGRWGGRFERSQNQYFLTQKLFLLREAVLKDFSVRWAQYNIPSQKSNCIEIIMIIIIRSSGRSCRRSHIVFQMTIIILMVAIKKHEDTQFFLEKLLPENDTQLQSNKQRLFDCDGITIRIIIII